MRMTRYRNTRNDDTYPQQDIRLEQLRNTATEYFLKYGEVRPTLAVFRGHQLVETIQTEFSDDADKLACADQMVDAAVAGATSVALIVEGWAAPDDATKTEVLLVILQDAKGGSTAIAEISRDTHGKPKLSEWTLTVDRQQDWAIFSHIFERAEIRKRSRIAYEVAQPAATLLLTSTGNCVRNDQGHALVVSSELMARCCVERHTRGGIFRAVAMTDHLDLVVGGFELAEAGICYFPGRENLEALRMALNEARRMCDGGFPTGDDF